MPDDCAHGSQFGEVATWLTVNRAGLTIFAHASTGDDLADHSRNVVWFGPSEVLDLTMFDGPPLEDERDDDQDDDQRSNTQRDVAAHDFSLSG